MRLKLKNFKISAGKPVAFLNESDATKLGLHTGERIIISNGEKLIAVIDITKGVIKKGEIAVSQEIWDRMKINFEKFLDISLPPMPETPSILRDKVGCKSYSQEDLNTIMANIANNSLTDAEIAYFVSGVSNCGMSMKETIFLTKAIFNTGKKLTWGSEKVADKHSIGGIPGNRTTPIVVSICAAAGVLMPKTSSRAITSAAGTADSVESIAKVDLSIEELKRVVKKTGGCLAWGGSLGLAPADDKLIKVEKLLRLDPQPQLIASILAKKLAAGSKYVLIDLPYGDGAKVSYSEGRKLKKIFEQITKKLHLKVKVVLTKGDEPIGNGIGPSLEMRDIIRVLSRNNPPQDLEKKSLFLSGLILEMTGKVKKGHGMKRAKEILYSGKAFEKFLEIIKEQQGDINRLRFAPYSHAVISTKAGRITRIKNNDINYLARIAGCPLDKEAGLYLFKHKGERVKKGEKLLTIYAETPHKLREAIEFYKKLEPIIIS